MAGIRKKGGVYYCTFQFQGKRYYFTIGNLSEDQSAAKGTEVDETLALLERGRLSVPEGTPCAYSHPDGIARPAPGRVPGPAPADSPRKPNSRRRIVRAARRLSRSCGPGRKAVSDRG
jgi:hypothetical protein